MRFKMDREEEILICKLPVVPPQRTKDMDDITAFSGALICLSSLILLQVTFRAMALRG